MEIFYRTYATGTVANIDKLAPNNFTPTLSSSTSNSITISASTQDTSSGIKSYKYSKDNGSTWQDSNTFGSLTESTYTVKVKAIDNAGNETISNALQIGATYHSHTGNSSSGGGCYGGKNYHSHTSSCYHTHTSKTGSCYTKTSTQCGGIRRDNGEGYRQCDKCGSLFDINDIGPCPKTVTTYKLTCTKSTSSPICGKTTSTVISYYLNCGKTTSTVVSYYTTCGKTTSTITGYVAK